MSRDANTPIHLRMSAKEQIFLIGRDLLSTLVRIGMPQADAPDPALAKKLVELIRKEVGT